MSKTAIIKCNNCNFDIKNVETWILKDIENFTARKLFFANCPKCGEPVVTLLEKRISDGKVFINNNIQGLNAVKTLYRERKRIVTKVFDVKTDTLYGWIYGVNVAIKNKKGDVTQIRQYASDFHGKKQLTKVLKI